MSEKRQIQLPEELCAAAEQRYAAQFPNLEALLEFLLKEVVRDGEAPLDRAEHAMLEKRLRDLGYM